MLFDFVRAAFAGPRTACTDLSRRLRDGVLFGKRIGFLWNGLCYAKSASVVDSLRFQGWAAEKRVHYQRFHAKLTL